MANLEDHPLVNLSRSSNQTYFDSNGVLQTAPANSLPPSYEYNGSIWEKKGWYIGEERTNLLTDSEDFSQWFNQDTGDAEPLSFDETGLDGNASAQTLQDNNSGGIGTVSVGEVLTLDTGTYTFSAFAKAGQLDWITIRTIGVDQPGYTYFDLLNGLIGNDDNFASSIKDYGNGWYRISVTVEISSDGTSIQTYFYLANSDGTGAPSVDKDGTSSVILYGAQLEEGSFPSPYIPTSGSTVTRSATLADITDLSWYNQDEGTFVVEVENIATDLSRILIVRNTSTNNRHLMGALNDKMWFYSDSGWNINNGDITGTGTQKLSASYSQSLAISVLNGTVVGQDNTFSLITNINKLIIGYREVTNEDYINGYLKSLKYYPKRLSNSQLQSLTS